MYPSEIIAEEALISAWIAYSYTKGNGPIGVYLCADCGSYHLTSKGVMNQKLAEQLTSGKIQQNKEANKWLDKINKHGKR
jgi:hypothetical protein